MGCKTRNHFINKYRPRVVSCELGICEVFAHILADLWDENWTAPGFMRCVWKRFAGSLSVKPDDFGIPRLKGKLEKVKATLGAAGFDESKLCFPEKTYPNFNDVFRHVGGLFVLSYLLGRNLSHLQDWDNDRQREDAEEELHELRAQIGAGTPTAEQQARIDKLEDRIAETRSENDCNHLGRKLFREFPWTIFNSRDYVYDVAIRTLCRCEVSERAATGVDGSEAGGAKSGGEKDVTAEGDAGERAFASEYDAQRIERVSIATHGDEQLYALKPRDASFRINEELIAYVLGDDFDFGRLRF